MPCSDPCSDIPLGGPLIFLDRRWDDDVDNVRGDGENNERDDVHSDDINESDDDNNLNEIPPYIGSSGTFRRELSSCRYCPVVVRTSASWGYDHVSTSGSAPCWVHRVDVADQCRRANEVGSRTSIAAEWGVHVEESSCACMGARCTGRDAYPSSVPKSEPGP